MKTTLLILFFSCSIFSQTAVYNKITAEGKFKEYQSKNGSLIKVGDIISIGLPANGREYLFISQNNFPSDAVLANTKHLIKKITTTGNSKKGFKTSLFFGGYGISVYYKVDIESALELGEVKEIIPPTQTN